MGQSILPGRGREVSIPAKSVYIPLQEKGISQDRKREGVGSRVLSFSCRMGGEKKKLLACLRKKCFFFWKSWYAAKEGEEGPHSTLYSKKSNVKRAPILPVLPGIFLSF